LIIGQRDPPQRLILLSGGNADIASCDRRFLPVTAALEQGRPHDKSKDKEDHKSNDKDEEEHLSDPGSRSRDPSEAEQAGDDRNNEEE
jgi:hypothetical protein